MRWYLLIMGVVALAGCAPAPSAAPAPAPAAVQNVPPATIAPPSSTPLAPREVAATQTAQAQATSAAVYATPAPTEIIGALEQSTIIGAPEQSTKSRLQVQRLAWKPRSEPLLMVSTGSNRIYGHFVAVYTGSKGNWRELDKVYLQFGLLDLVKQVQVEPSHVWIEISGVNGITFVNYQLLAFDGTKFTRMVDHIYGIGYGRLEDIDHDGTPEAMLSNTGCVVSSPHVCDIGLPGFAIQRWDGVRFVDAPLAPLPSSAPAELRRLTNQAVTFAAGGRWKEAQAVMSQTLTLQPQSSQYHINAALIRRYAEARAEWRFSRAGDYPFERFAYNLSYGDYDAVVQQMRAVPVAALFSKQSPVLLEDASVPRDFGSLLDRQIREWLLTTTAQALKADADFAPAYFLRGWATYFACPRDPQMLADLARAARLAPNEPLFAQSLAYAKRTYKALPAECSTIR